MRCPHPFATITLPFEVRAGDCTGCGACEANCPFGVPIAQRMEETAALFGA